MGMPGMPMPGMPGMPGTILGIHKLKVVQLFGFLVDFIITRVPLNEKVDEYHRYIIDRRCESETR